ncbi:hypothetical protein [Nocardia transvalensis]|uniref:hypothetical protein n=1 Tax=Nocardia transvalensis TaxID=37333 RepID=UPI0018960952|nr:hypothetical protein [Nocardia transvalensis]MBF6331620.1 hypothetical protein [Nocardia transvalensis]
MSATELSASERLGREPKILRQTPSPRRDGRVVMYGHVVCGSRAISVDLVRLQRLRNLVTV